MVTTTITGDKDAVADKIGEDEVAVVDLFSNKEKPIGKNEVEEMPHISHASTVTSLDITLLTSR